MSRPRKEPVEKICDECGGTFRTRHPARARFCPGSKCRSAFWDKQHRVEDKEAFAQSAVRAYWRRTKRAFAIISGQPVKADGIKSATRPEAHEYVSRLLSHWQVLRAELEPFAAGKLAL